jgi:hypothetical protein
MYLSIRWVQQWCAQVDSNRGWRKETYQAKLSVERTVDGPPSEQRHANVSQESLEDAALFESVRDDPATPQIMANLLNDSHPWIRDYAVAWSDIKKIE